MHGCLNPGHCALVCTANPLSPQPEDWGSMTAQSMYCPDEQPLLSKGGPQQLLTCGMVGHWVNSLMPSRMSASAKTFLVP